MSAFSNDGFVHLVHHCNNFIHADSIKKCVPFFIKNQCVGLIRSDILPTIVEYKIFEEIVNLRGQKEVHLSLVTTDFEERCRAVEEVLLELHDKNSFVTLNGWRDEVYSIKSTFDGVNLLNIERSAACLFGIIQYGTHLNGYLYDSEGNMHMWIAERSLSKQTFPGLYDNLCAGGLPSGMGIRDCMEKEALEEAGLTFGPDIKLKSVGCVSYFYEDQRGLFPECMFIFDAELPRSFKPENMDGEVKDFHLLPIEEVVNMIVSDRIVFNCALIILDFLIRHGFVTPDNEVRYAYLVEKMHVPLQRMFAERNFYF